MILKRRPCLLDLDMKRRKFFQHIIDMCISKIFEYIGCSVVKSINIKAAKHSKFFGLSDDYRLDLDPWFPNLW